jgi:uncharacterized membrane protein
MDHALIKTDYFKVKKMSWYLALRFLHISMAIILVGGIFARQLVRGQAKKADNIQIFAALSQAAGRIESFMVIPGSSAVLILGVILALITGAPIFGLLQGAPRNWLLVANILLILILLAVPLILVPRGKKFDLVLQEALAVGQITPTLRARLDDKVVKLIHLYEEIALVIIVALMVFKPF